MTGAMVGAGAVGIARFPRLTVSTPRLNVEPVGPGDGASVDEIFADRQCRRWLPLPYGVESFEAQDWCTVMAHERRQRGTGDNYSVVRREDARTVGLLWTERADWVARSVEVMYAVASVARGYGVAAEAVDALAIALILEHGFQRVELRVVPGNTAARRVAEKAGFTYEGLLRNAGVLHSGRVDLEMWSLVANDLRGEGHHP